MNVFVARVAVGEDDLATNTAVIFGNDSTLGRDMSPELAFGSDGYFYAFELEVCNMHASKLA